MLDEDPNLHLRGNTMVFRPNEEKVVRGEITVTRAQDIEDDVRMTIANLNSHVNRLEEEAAWKDKRIAELEERVQVLAAAHVNADATA